MMSEKSPSEMSNRELFEHVKDLREAVKELREDCNNPYMVAEMSYLPNALYSCIEEYNECYRALFRRVFKRKIFKPVQFI